MLSPKGVNLLPMAKYITHYNINFYQNELNKGVIYMEITLLIKTFVKDYAKAIQDSNAAIFAGAGLSKSAGFVDWKNLLKEIAEDIGLIVEQEDDLISLAQYHVNEFKRNKIDETILNEFTKNINLTENHNILARLPIKTYWTTNYDSLVEDAFKEAEKQLSIKIDPKSISQNMSNKDATLYKMHGDIKDIANTVITKDDYEGYDIKRKLFTTSLIGDLTTKTFLFIGYSFNDPNLTYILSRVHSLLGQSTRTHYCFMKEEDLKTYKYIKQNLIIKNLERYGVKTIIIKEYSDITLILKLIENQYRYKNIFISGSAHEYEKYTEKEILKFASDLSKSLITLDKNVVTGFGLGIGSNIISGALEELYSKDKEKIENRLILRPFPHNIQDPTKRKETFTKYREDMLSEVGIAIFLLGNKFDATDGTVQLSGGVYEEFDIAVKNLAIPIPIGAFGYVSKKLWEIVMKDYDKYVPIAELKDYYSLIGDNTNSLIEILKATTHIVEELSKIK